MHKRLWNKVFQDYIQYTYLEDNDNPPPPHVVMGLSAHKIKRFKANMILLKKGLT